jgi:GT2 family glycosyltransferase
MSNHNSSSEACAPPIPAVCVVLLNWNGTSDTLDCLSSLRGLDYTNFYCVLVDNGSREPCTIPVRRQFPEVYVIESDRNLGFTGGNNLGMQVALERGAEYVWLLNNDTVVEPSTLSELVAAAEADPIRGVLGSKIYFYDSDRTVDHAGGIWNSDKCEPKHIGCGESDTGQFDRLASVFFVTGCSFFIRRSVLETIGFLDESFFCYMEDVDFCTRARLAGWTIVYVPSSLLHHKGGSVTETSPRQHYLYARNRLKYVSRHHPSLLHRALFWWVRDCIVGPVRTGHWRLLAPSVRALRDWLLLRGGAQI